MEVYYLTTCVLTAISLIFTALTFCKLFICKKEKVTLTACRGKVDDNTLELLVLYNCIGNKNITITNAYIQLDKKDNIAFFSTSNHKVSREGISPFMLHQYEHKHMYLKYDLPAIINEANVNDILVRVNTEYIDSEGRVRLSYLNAGHLFSNDRVKCTISVHRNGETLLGALSTEFVQI
jgi:hypothetical protein